MIADYRISTISEIEGKEDGECQYSLFDRSLNIISNLLSETWIPRVDSYTTYLGEQNIKLAPHDSFYAFRTISSDDVSWDVFFNVRTGHPQFAIAEAGTDFEK